MKLIHEVNSLQVVSAPEYLPELFILVIFDWLTSQLVDCNPGIVENIHIYTISIG